MIVKIFNCRIVIDFSPIVFDYVMIVPAMEFI